MVSAEAGSVTMSGAGTPEVERGHPDGRSLVVAADHHPVGVQEVVDGRALAQELGVGHHGHVAAAQRLLDPAGGADRHRRLVDHHGARRQDRGDLGGRLLDVAQVGRAVRALRGGHAQVGELGARRRRSAAPSTKLSRPESQALAHQLVEPGLEDRDLAPRQALDLLGHHVGADHVVPEMGEARAGGQTRRSPSR